MLFTYFCLRCNPKGIASTANVRLLDEFDFILRSKNVLLYD
jgi:hypothetical protein